MMMIPFAICTLSLLLGSISTSHGHGAAKAVRGSVPRPPLPPPPSPRELSHKSDPYLNANFQVYIEGIVDNDSSFELVGGLESETEVEEYKDGNELLIHKMPALTHYNNIILKRRFRGDDQDDGLNLWIWYQGGANGDYAPKDGYITITDKYENPLIYFHFYDAFPVRYETFQLEGAASKKDDRILMEEIEIAVEKMVLSSPAV